MQIKFVKPDPRAGMVVQMDSARGAQLVESGAAVAHKESADEPKPEPAKAVTTETVPAKAAKKTAKKKAK